MSDSESCRSYAQVHATPRSFPVPVDTTTQNPWLRVWTAAFLVLQDIIVRRKDWQKCLGSARPVSWSVCAVLFFCFLFFFFCPKIQSQQYGLVYQCQDFILFAMLFVSHGQQISRKQSWKSWWSRRRKCRLSVRHHSFLASWDTVLLFLPERY